jgi:hypothetical protein
LYGLVFILSSLGLPCVALFSLHICPVLLLVLSHILSCPEQATLNARTHRVPLKDVVFNNPDPISIPNPTLTLTLTLTLSLTLTLTPNPNPNPNPTTNPDPNPNPNPKVSKTKQLQAENSALESAIAKEEVLSLFSYLSFCISCPISLWRAYLLGLASLDLSLLSLLSCFLSHCLALPIG